MKSGKATLHEYLSMFVELSCSVLLRMRNTSDKSHRENQNTLLLIHNDFPKITPFVGYCGKKNTVEPDKPQMTT